MFPRIQSLSRRLRDSFVSYFGRKPLHALHAPTLPNWVHPAVEPLYGVSKYLSLPFLILLCIPLSRNPAVASPPVRDKEVYACLYLKATDRMKCTIELSPHVVERSRRRFLHLVRHLGISQRGFRKRETHSNRSAFPTVTTCVFTYLLRSTLLHPFPFPILVQSSFIHPKRFFAFLSRDSFFAIPLHFSVYVLRVTTQVRATIVSLRVV